VGDRSSVRERDVDEIDFSILRVLDYPAPTEDLEEAKANIDEFGIALVANALSPEDVAANDLRVTDFVRSEC
jgi:hypothetical protein